MDVVEAAESPCADAQITNKTFSIIIKTDVFMMARGNGEESLLITKLGLILNYILL